MTTQRGGRLATSVGGTLLGRGGNLFILDDPVKPEEALSDAARAKAIQWIEHTMLTRLNNKAEDAIILVMQRLHEADPAGIFLRKGGWMHLNLPAIADDASLNKEPGDHMVISWDTALKETEIADFSIATVWFVRKDNCYLVDLKRGKYDFPNLLRAALQLKQQYREASTLVEDRGSGISLIQELRHSGANAIAIKPDQDKVTRLFTTQPMFESGSVFFPRDVEWVQGLTRELLSFPNTRHDDQVDSVSQALNWIRERSFRRQSVSISPPILITRDGPVPFPYQPFSRFPE